MHAAASARVVDADWGVAYLNPARPKVYTENFLWAASGATGLDAHADRLIGGAGMGHRRVLVTLPANLALDGYDRDEEVFLALDGPPPPGLVVETAGIDDVLPAMERYLRTDPETVWARDDAVRAQVLDHHRFYGSAVVSEELHVVREDGEVVAWAKLWRGGGVAQVEDVVCLAGHRGRGYGRAVVSSAARAASNSTDLVFIVADAADWPIDLYRRLGFAEVGRIAVFTRHEPGHQWGAPLP
jgi:ribosomal protein S18 acetylase RimI-like enzyme